MRVLRTLADEDRHKLITLGVTPVVNAQLDDPYCLDGMQHWLANWRLRALEATSVRPPGRSRRVSSHAHQKHCGHSGIRECAEADGRSTTSRPCGPRRQPAVRSLIDADTSSCSAARWPPVPAAVAPRLREFACAKAWPTPRLRLAYRPTGIGRRSAPTPRAWNTTTTPRASPISWSTARRCTATPRWTGRSATPVCRVRPRPAGQLPGVVTEVGIPRTRRLPRFPHL